MSAKNRKKKQRLKAKNRTGLLHSLSGYNSNNQRAKRIKQQKQSESFNDFLRKKLQLS